jgi:hypothetical protein
MVTRTPKDPMNISDLLAVLMVLLFTVLLGGLLIVTTFSIFN